MLLASWACCPTLGACGVEDAPATLSEVRDSSGIRIVISDRALAEVEWAKLEGTLLRLGEVDGAPELLFDRVRAVRRLSDGTLLVADGGSRELRLFTPSGDLETRFGGPGEGPGEFTSLQAVIVAPGDSIIAFDSRARRLSAFDRTGAVHWERAVPIGQANLVGRLPDGAFLFAGGDISLPVYEQEGVQRRSRSYLRYDRDRPTMPIDTVSVVPGHEFDVVWVERTSAWATVELPFPHGAYEAIHPRGFVNGTNDLFSLTLRDPNGDPELVIRVRNPEVPLSPAEVEALEEKVLGDLDPTPARRMAIQRLFEPERTPTNRPAFADIITDDEGRVWVQDWRSAFDDGPIAEREWLVFDNEGELLGHLRVPGTIDLHDVGEDWVAGVETDSLGVEQVVVFTLAAGGR